MGPAQSERGGNSPEHRVQRSCEGDFFIPLDDLYVIDDGPSLLVGEGQRGGVGDPAVDPAAARVDPEEVLEVEVVCWEVRVQGEGADAGQRGTEGENERERERKGKKGSTE